MSLDPSDCREEPDERELLRLELVGLAAEVATLSVRIEEELAGRQPEAGQLTATRRLLSERAFSVLRPETSFDSIKTGALVAALRILREDQRRMLELRRQVAALRDPDQTVPCDLDLACDPPPLGKPAGP